MRSDPYRFDVRPGTASMMAVVTTGNGGFDTLVYHAVRRPQPAPGEVLLRVLAAGVNNTEINTRVGWYEGGGWTGSFVFPRIRGIDACGREVAVGAGVASSRLRKQNPTTVRLTAIPTSPVSSRGRRPKRSTYATAMSVASTLTAPTA